MTSGTAAAHHQQHLQPAATKPLAMDKTRRKRLKVVSACGECRRKKTKCNGEQPCSGCIKANVDCKYTMSSAAAARANGSTAPANHPARQHFIAPQHQQQPRIHQHTTKQYCHQRKDDSVPRNATSNIQAIEQRLAVIENILHALLASSGKSIDHGHLLLALDRPHPEQPQQQQPQQQQPQQQQPRQQQPRQQNQQQEENLMATYYYSPPQKRPYDDDSVREPGAPPPASAGVASSSVRSKGGYPPSPPSSSMTTPAPPAFLSPVQLAPLKHHPGPSSPSIRNLLNDAHIDPPDELPSSSPLSSCSSTSSAMSPTLRQPHDQHASAFQRVASNAFS